MISALHIQTALRGDKTYLQRAYCDQPFKVVDITEDKKDKTLQLMLMNSSPGILDGDEYKMKIELQKDCSLQLSTQSYQRLFSMKNGASQNIEVHLEPGSSFYFIPHPSVPHESSVFIGKNKIFLSADCRLIWGEILTCGRKLNGEVFRYSKYHAVTEIFLNNKLIIKENLMINPSRINLNAIGQLEGYTHQATLIYVNENFSINYLTEKITEYLSSQNEITFGITVAPVNGLIIRLLGQKAEQLHDCLKMIAEKIIITSHTKIEYAI